MSVLVQKCHPYTGDLHLEMEMSWDSEKTRFHVVEMFRAMQPCLADLK